MLTVYGFDVDETLEVGRPPGPIKIIEMLRLRKEGHHVGIIGNWHQFVKSVSNWGDYCDFLTPIVSNGQGKVPYLDALRNGIPADDHCLVGNIGGVTGMTYEDKDAKEAGWRFISETDFANGAR